MKRFLISLAISSLILTGCAYNQMGPKETAGTVLGAAGGAVLGSQIGSGRGQLVAVAVGTLAGAIIGKEIGKSLDTTDKLAMERNAQYSLEHTRTNTTTTWQNPDSGNYGSVTPTKTYQTNEGKYCREYTQTVVIDGKEQRAYGNACRQPDGSWMVVR